MATSPKFSSKSKTDSDAKMARKGKEAKLSYNGNPLVENRNGRIVNTRCSRPTERRSAMPRQPSKIRVALFAQQRFR